MKSTIGIYENHEAAINAVVELKNEGYPVKHISIMGLEGTEKVDNDMHVFTKDPIKIGGVAVGAALGTTLGALTGVGLFAIPGLGFLVGAGAVIGAIAGFDFGLVGGGLVSALVSLGIGEASARKYHDAMKDGKYLVIVKGSHEEIEKANEILTKHGTHTDLEAHQLAEKEEQKQEQEKKSFLDRIDTSFPLSGGETKL